MAAFQKPHLLPSAGNICAFLQALLSLFFGAESRSFVQCVYTKQNPDSDLSLGIFEVEEKNALRKNEN